MTSFVEQLLKKVSDDETLLRKNVCVEKQIELHYDLGNLTANDMNPIDTKQLRDESESFLKQLTRDNTQLIINKLWDLETQRIDNLIVAKLPKMSTMIARAKRVPKQKPPTKWEMYAKEKGIQKKKKEKLVWNESSKGWRPRFGYRGVNQTNNWLIEVPQNADPNIDYFEKQRNEKSERIAKNEYHRLRNIARYSNVKVAGTDGIEPNPVQTKQQLLKAGSLSKHSTASMGKFAEELPREKRMKNSGKKRQFEPNLANLSHEKEKNLKIINDIITKKPKLNIEKTIDVATRDNMRRKNDSRKNMNRNVKKSKNKSAKNFRKTNVKKNDSHQNRGKRR